MENIRRMSKALFIGAYLGGLGLGWVAPVLVIAVMPALLKRSFSGPCSGACPVSGEGLRLAELVPALILSSGIFFLLCSALAVMVFIYDMWRSIQDGRARTSPGLAFALLFALLLNLNIRGQAIWRTIYILPTLMPAVASALLWQWILNPKLGIINHLLSLIGIKAPLWFTDPTRAKPAIILMLTWSVGFTTILYLAALQGVPTELYESAVHN